MAKPKKVKLPMLDEVNIMYKAEHSFKICEHKLDLSAYRIDKKYLGEDYTNHFFEMGKNLLGQGILKRLLDEGNVVGCMNEESEFYTKLCGKEEGKECPLYAENRFTTMLPPMNFLMESDIRGARLGELSPSYSLTELNVLGKGRIRDRVIKDNLIENLQMNLGQNKED